ncbi:TPA: hypothetical protein N0F65_009804 [Lagenidium giganteum]|uniref:AP-3 complex subunit delta n=1 Tax=Lagenidium giganteum TaxID=4803 RepID=A0AAV2YJR0_9STRA|nr:TPA: hypothetical protein N0F65_009804 [Lagenidium giganteum]
MEVRDVSTSVEGNVGVGHTKEGVPGLRLGQQSGDRVATMGVLWNFFLSSLLLTNAVCILHEKRFLRKYGWDRVDSSEGMTIKNQIVGFLVAMQYLRYPLIIVNILMIMMELDLVKGIRSTKGDVNVYISQCMQEIKTELKSMDPFVKSQAVRKLTYLHMLGYDMCWAAFHVVEVMSYERFAHKRIGYNAASQSFTQSTDVVLLCTNLLKKEFSSVNEYEVGLAINVLANIVTTDLARDLLGDVVAMLNSPKTYVRKKSTLVLYKMFLRYPQGLRLTFDKLKERMEEPDVSVVSCAVNVICELANKKPKNYLGLAPQFFRLLTTSSNNWMLIKVVKLMASLVPEEPRLARKLLDPLATIIQNTPAKSLLYECIQTVTTALLYTKKSDGAQPRNVPAVVRLCNDHLRRYIEDPDQNLRYLGLVGLSNLMLSHPYVITEHQELIVECLAVDDMTIRMRSLDLLAGMVHPDNAAQIIRELMRQTLSADGMYRHELITRILHVCSVNKYENIHDFDWYIHVLVQLARVPGNTAAFVDSSLSSSSSAFATNSDGKAKSHGVEVARQLVDIAVRVKSVRSVMVDNMMDLLMEKEAMSGPGANTLCEVYYAAAWIAGEYVMEYLEDSDEDDEDEDDSEERETEEEKLDRIYDLVDEMLQPRTTSLPAHVQTVFIQTMLKLLTVTAEKADDESVERLAEMIMERLPAFVQSEYIEVQERAVCLHQLLLALGLGMGALSPEERASHAFDNNPTLNPSTRLDILNAYFAERLAPVGAKAQRKVPLPGDFDLDVPFNSSEAAFLESGGDVSAFSNEDDLEVSFVQQNNGGYNGFDERRRKVSYDKSESESSSSESEDDREAREKEYAQEKERLRKDPFYLSANASAAAQASETSIMDALDSSKKKKKKSSSKKSKKSRAILEDELMPDGARSSDEDRRRTKRKPSKTDDLASVDLLVPLEENEKIPDEHLFHRQAKVDNEPVEKRKKKKSSKEQEKESSKRKKSSSSKSKHRDDAKDKKHARSSKKESKENIYANVSSSEDDEREKNGHSKRSSSSTKKHSSARQVERRRIGTEGEEEEGEAQQGQEHEDARAGRAFERMEEPDASVVSCAVNVICELANKKPKNYLGLAPQFFRLLTTSSNNWMLIKVVKLMASLVPEEPRLARKLLDPLATIIQNTPAKSLLYECIQTVTTALLYTKKSDGAQPRNVPAVVRLCNGHLRRYVEDPDQNLRYLGLVGLSNLMLSHPYVITEHQELIVECLAVDDMTIRMRSLDLLAGMVHPDNAAQIIRELMRQTLSADGMYRHELITRILHVCSVNKYENIHDFDWYIHVLVQLARVPGNTAAFVDSSLSSSSSAFATNSDGKAKSHGVEVARQLVDIAVRVKSVRSVMVDNMMDLLMEKEAMSGPGANTLCEVYYAAAWIAGEYVMEYLEDSDEDDEDEDDSEERETEEEKLDRIYDLVDEMLQPRTTSLPAHVQTVFIQTMLKLLTVTAEKADDESVERLAEMIMERLPAFVQSEYIEVQERAVCLHQLLLALGLGMGALSPEERASHAFDNNPTLNPSTRLDILNAYFAERLAPVGAKAQRKVPLPGDFDLDVPFNSSEAAFLESGGDVSAFSNEDDLEVSFVQQNNGGYNGFDERRRKVSYDKSESESSSSEAEDDREAREKEYAQEKERLRKDPFYLSANASAAAQASETSGFAEIMDALDSSKKKKKKSSSKKSKKSRAILEDELMPDGARSSDEDRRRTKRKPSKTDDLASVDLLVPLEENEKIPDEHLFHRQAKVDNEPVEKRKKKKSSKEQEKESSKRKKSSSSKSKHRDDAKDKKHARSSKKESKENIYANVSSSEDDEREKNGHSKRSSSSTKKHSSGKSSKRDKSKDDGSALKEKKKKEKRSKDKNTKTQEQDEPLLLF